MKTFLLTELSETFSRLKVSLYLVLFYFCLGSKYCVDVCGSGRFDGYNLTHLSKALVLAHLYFLRLYFKFRHGWKVYRLVCGMVVNLFSEFCCMEL